MIDVSPHAQRLMRAFHVEPWLQVVEQLVQHDEIERALLVLDNLPALYRDHTPPELRKLKQEILRARWTPLTYAQQLNLEDEIPDDERAVTVLRYLFRGRLIEAEVNRYNSKGVTPHIIDFGPGSYFISRGLNALNYKFTYEALSLQEATKKRKPEVEARDIDTPIIFAALEVIEHMPEPKDILTEMLRVSLRWPERIHLSTPCYTFDIQEKWREAGSPHLRAYTPSEFYNKANELFPGYHFDFYADQIMSIRGQRADTADHEKLG